MIRHAAVCAVYLPLTALVVHPLVDFTRLDSASYEGDARLLVWTLAWGARALLTGTPLFDANIFHPEARSLAFAEHHIGIGVFAAPLLAVTGNPVLTYWMLWLAAFPLNALTMYAMAWRITRDRVAAFSAGCIYAFCFFRMHHAHGHVQLLWTWAMPLVPLAMDWWLQKATLPRAAAVGALVILQALASWYLAVFVALLAVVSFIFLAPGRFTRTHLVQAVGTGGVGLAVIMWFAEPYFALAAGSAAEAAANAADAKAYLLPPENTWIGQQLARRTSITPRWIWGERTLYVSTAVLVLSAFGGLCMTARNWHGFERARRLLSAALVTGGIALALSLGPSETGVAPFDLLEHIPGLSLLRAPARFALLVMLAASALSALGVAWLRARHGWRGTLVAAALIALFLGESFVVAFPAGRPSTLEMPAVYGALASLPPGAVLSLPTYRATPEAFREADYLLFSTSHWRAIVNGFGRQEPPGHAARMAALAGFPSTESIALMRQTGVRYVVMHTRRAPELAARAEAARSEAAVRLIDSTDGDHLFEVR